MTVFTNNKSVTGNLRNRRDFLKLASGWKDPHPPPVVAVHGNFFVVREDLLSGGSKSRYVDLMVSRSSSDHFVYATSRVGFAGIALAEACSRHGKRFTLFVGAAHSLSDYQVAALEAGAEIRCVRVASLRNLMAKAEEFAHRSAALFVPLGLHHKLVTAAIVKTCADMDQRPAQVWSAIATGVLSRGIQIAWPQVRFYAVAVGRSLAPDECGLANVIRYDKPFASPARVNPPFPSVRNYDAKAWEVMQKKAARGALFWNVAGPPTVKDDSLATAFDTWREWDDMSDTLISKKPIKL